MHYSKPVRRNRALAHVYSTGRYGWKWTIAQGAVVENGVIEVQEISADLVTFTDEYSDTNIFPKKETKYNLYSHLCQNPWSSVEFRRFSISQFRTKDFAVGLGTGVWFFGPNPLFGKRMRNYEKLISTLQEGLRMHPPFYKEQLPPNSHHLHKFKIMGVGPSNSHSPSYINSQTHQLNKIFYNSTPKFPFPFNIYIQEKGWYFFKNKKGRYFKNIHNVVFFSLF